MRASTFEYRARYALHALVYILGFWAPWVHYFPNTGFSNSSVWVAGCVLLARHGWLGFGSAVRVFLSVVLLLTAAGAWFRVWGAAYVGSSVVQSGTMHGETLLADGPYRHTRNPLYFGTLLHTFGLAILMPVSGAVFTITLIWLLQIRLALAEEPFLAERFGQAYTAYCARVPRFVPSFSARVAAGSRPARWVQAILGEVYFIGVFFTLLLFGWSFNATPILRGILISCGLSIVLQALLPRPAKQGAPLQ